MIDFIFVVVCLFCLVAFYSLLLFSSISSGLVVIFDPVAFLLLLFSALLFPHCCGCLPGIVVVVVVELGCCDSGWVLGFFVG